MLPIDFLKAADDVCGECFFRTEKNCNKCFVRKMCDLYNGEITRDLIVEGINQKIVRFGWPDNGEDTVCCLIGDNWFYFGGLAAEQITPSEYIRVTDMDENIDNIMTVLNDFKTLCPDEYFYYYHYLKENLK